MKICCIVLIDIFLEVTLFFKFRNKAIIVPFPRLVIAFLFLREGEKEYEKNKSNYSKAYI